MCLPYRSVQILESDLGEVYYHLENWVCHVDRETIMLVYLCHLGFYYLVIQNDKTNKQTTKPHNYRASQNLQFTFLNNFKTDFHINEF